MIMEGTIQTEIIIHEGSCEEKMQEVFENGSAVNDSKSLLNIRLSSGPLHKDMILKEEVVDDPSEEYEDDDLKFSRSLKDVATVDGTKTKKRKKKNEKTYPCEKCSLVSQSSANFKKHMMTHSGERPYKCVICQKAFRQMHHLSDHRRTHTGERPFECEECGSKFVQKSSLNLHRKKHSGIKPYSCNICNHSTYEKMHLKMHMRTHTGEKPYQCEKCGQTFSNSTRLKFHTMIHTGERLYKCDECGVSFREKVTLQKHKGVHINVGPFACEECGQEFSRLAGLALHRKVHSKDCDYLYVFNKEANEILKSLPSEASKDKTTTKHVFQTPGKCSNIVDRTDDVTAATFETQDDGTVMKFADSTGVSPGEHDHSKNCKSDIQSLEDTTHNSCTSPLTRNIIIKSKVEFNSVTDCLQNKLKENLASNLSENNKQSLSSVVHPDHVRAALETGTVLETQGGDGKGFFIVLPPSLKNKEIIFSSDSVHTSSSAMTEPQAPTNMTVDLPGNETMVEYGSAEIFTQKICDSHNETYHGVDERDVCTYPVEAHEMQNEQDSSHVIEVEEGLLDDDNQNFEDAHVYQVEVPDELANDEHSYSRAVQKELHPDGTSVFLWNDELEHLTDVTYVIEEGKEDPITIHMQGVKNCSSELLGATAKMIPHRKRKLKKSELPVDIKVKAKKQKRQKHDSERPPSVRNKVKDKKIKEKKVKIQRVYDCPHCGKACKTSSNYISHMRTHSGERPYFCDICGMAFKQIAHLRSHIRIHTGERPYVCSLCNAAFTQSSRLNSHTKSKHPEGKIVVKKAKPVVEHKVRNFYCKICKKTFINECFKIDHMRTHFSLSPYECEVCGIHYKTKGSMTKHKLVHSDYKCICELCGTSFSDLSSLQNHRVFQHDESLREGGISDVCINVKIGEEKDFVVINPSIKNIQNGENGVKVKEEIIDVTEVNSCQVIQEVIHVTDADGCVKSEVMTAADVDDTNIKSEVLDMPESEGCKVELEQSPTNDVKVKNEEQPTDGNKYPLRNDNPFQKSVSEFQTFDSKESVKDEFSKMRIHATYIDNMGRKIWVCKVCDRSFLQSSNLHSHMRMHTGERPYKCNICSQAFRQITHLKDHMSRHTGIKPYKCGECGSCFSQRSAVTRHIRNLHNENAIVIRNTEVLLVGKKNIPSLDCENLSSGCKQPSHDGETVSRKQNNRNFSEEISSSPLLKMKKCDVCEKQYPATYLKSHLRCHTGERPYKCSFCEEAFKQKAHLNSHELRHTGERPYVCENCGASFTQSFRCSTHMRKCMRSNNKVNTDSVRRCQCVCGTNFRLRAHLVRHQKNCSVVEDSDKSTGVSELDISYDEESEVECKIRRKNKIRKNLKRDLRRNKTMKVREFSSTCIFQTFTCKNCNITFQSVSEYKTHLSQHGDMLQVCETCGATFRRASALRFHQSVKHGRTDERYKEFDIIEQEYVKEEQLDGVSDGEDDTDPGLLHDTNNENNAGHQNDEKQMKENDMKFKERLKKDDVEGSRTQTKRKRKVENDSAIPLQEVEDKGSSNKPIEEIKLQKGKKPGKLLKVANAKHEMEASRILANKHVNGNPRKKPVGEPCIAALNILYPCKACGKVFTRSSKLKHHVRMWCKGLQDSSENKKLKSNKKVVSIQQCTLQRGKRVKRKFGKVDKELTEKNLSAFHDTKGEYDKGFKGIANSAKNLPCQSKQLFSVKEEVDSDYEKITNTLDQSENMMCEEQEIKLKPSEDEYLGTFKYCRDCDRRFTNAYSFKVHIQTHSGEQPFSCDQCSMVFKQKAHLTTHYKRHLDEKPYQCDVCEKAFTQSSSLKDHVRILHGKN